MQPCLAGDCAHKAPDRDVFPGPHAPLLVASLQQPTRGAQIGDLETRNVTKNKTPQRTNKVVLVALLHHYERTQ